MAYQGIGKSNMLGHRVGAGNATADAEDEAITKVYANRFCIPLDFGLPRHGSTIGFHLLWHTIELAMSTRLCLL